MIEACTGSLGYREGQVQFCVIEVLNQDRRKWQWAEYWEMSWPGISLRPTFYTFLWLLSHQQSWIQLNFQDMPLIQQAFIKHRLHEKLLARSWAGIQIQDLASAMTLMLREDVGQSLQPPSNSELGEDGCGWVSRGNLRGEGGLGGRDWWE